MVVAVVTVSAGFTSQVHRLPDLLDSTVIEGT